MTSQEALVEHAIKIFNEGFNCAQSSFVALSDHWGLKANPRVATCFGGGIGRTGGACGILTGSLMALGLLTGNDTPSDIEAKERASKLARGFIEEFRKLQNALDCNTLIGLDISTPEGHDQMGPRQTKQKVCIPLMKRAMALMDDFAKREGLVK